MKRRRDSYDLERRVSLVSPRYSLKSPLVRFTQGYWCAIEARITRNQKHSVVEEEWEIKRRDERGRAMSTGYEYRVRWEDLWLPKSELGNARRLLLKFEARAKGHC